jgi:predicted anti-sigma-YlaC factor YlaD
MLNLVPQSDCIQAREAASARLDGELAELDAARLDAHLDACAECRAMARGLQVTAALVRETPLEPPSRQLILPLRRSRPRSLHLRTAAAAAVLAAASFSVGQAVRQQPAGPVETVTAGAAPTSERASVLAHMLALVPASRVFSTPHMIRLGRNLPV